MASHHHDSPSHGHHDDSAKSLSVSSPEQVGLTLVTSTIQTVDEKFLPCCGLGCTVCECTDTCCPVAANCEFLGCLTGFLCFDGYCKFCDSFACGKCRHCLECKCESCHKCYNTCFCVGESGECCDCGKCCSLGKCFASCGCNKCYYKYGCNFCCPCIASCCIIDQNIKPIETGCCNCKEGCTCKCPKCFGKDGCCASIFPKKCCNCLPERFCCGCNFQGCTFPCTSCSSSYCNCLSIECACGVPLCSEVPCILNVLGCNICFDWSLILGCQNTVGELKTKWSEKKGGLLHNA